MPVTYKPAVMATVKPTTAQPVKQPVSTQQAVSKPKVQKPVAAQKPVTVSIPQTENVQPWVQKEINRLYQERIGYKPAYWEDPQRVGLYKTLIDNTPEMDALPEGIDRDAVNMAYDYFSFRNDGKPWWEWDFLPSNDPGRKYLQEYGKPPVDYLSYLGESAAALYEPVNLEAEQPQELKYFGFTKEQFEAMPWSQRALLNVFYTSRETGQQPVVENKAVAGALNWLGPAKVQGAATGALMGLATGNPIGGALFGMGMGGWAEKNKTIADLLLKLDYPAEVVERILGVMDISNLAMEKGGGVAAWAKTLIDPKAWQTAHLYYDIFPTTANKLVETKIIDPTSPEFTRIVPPGYAEDSLWNAYQEMSSGKFTPEEVYAKYQQEFGFSGIQREFLGHLILDPLNLVGGGAVKGIGLIAKTPKIAKTLGAAGDVLQIALKVTNGPMEAMRTYGSFLRSGFPKAITPDQFKAMNGTTGTMTRWLANVNADGISKDMTHEYKPSLASKAGGAFLQGGMAALISTGIVGPAGLIVAPFAARSGWKYGLGGMFRLTPEARATEFVNNSAVTMGYIFDAARKDPVLMDKYIKMVSNTSPELAREMSWSFLESPEAAALPYALRDFKKGDGLLKMWKITTDSRNALIELAEMYGKTPEKLLQDIAGIDDFEGFSKGVEEAARAAGDAGKPVLERIAAGKMTDETAAQWKKNYVKNRLPYTPEGYQQQLMISLMDHVEGWSAKWFGVQADPTWHRISKMVKAGQGLLTLGLNPAYFVNNFINNKITMAATGVLGLRTPKQIVDVWERAGIHAPPRLSAGLGPAAVGIEYEYPHIRAALAGENTGDWIAKTDNLFHATSRKLGIFTRLSGRDEAWSSSQAFTTGFVQGMSRMWRRGVGFDPLPPTLERGLRSIDPNLPGLIYSAIEGGMNQKEIEAQLWSGFARKTIDDVLPEVAREIGKPEAELRESLMGIGMFEELNQRILSKADLTDAEVNKIINNVVKKAYEHIDELARQELENRAETAKEKVKGEGFQAALEIWDDIEIDEAVRYMENFDDWSKIWREVKKDPNNRGEIIRQQFAYEEGAWNRQRLYKEASYLGIAEALGIDSAVAREFINYMKQGHDNWREFHTNKRMLLESFFGGAERSEVEYETLLKALDDLYIKHSKIEYDLAKAGDDLFGVMLERKYGEGAAIAAADWRKKVRDLRFEMTEAMRKHRDSVKKMKFEERDKAWNDFITGEFKPMIVEKMLAGVQGAHALYEKILGTKPPSEPTGMPQAPKPPETPPTKPVESGAPTRPVTPVEPIPSVVTMAQKQRLRDLGWYNSEIAKMTPEEAHNIITAGEFPFKRRTDYVMSKAKEYGVIPLDADEINRGDARHLLSIVNKYSGESAKFERIEDVSARALDTALERRLKVKEELKTINETTLLGPTSNLDKVVRASEVDYVKSAIIEEAKMMLDEIEHGGMESIKQTDDTGKEYYIKKSINPSWYRKIFAEKSISAEQAKAALNRIIKDEGADTIKDNDKALPDVKEALLARLAGFEPRGYGIDEMDSYPNLHYLVAIDMLDEAARGLKRMVDMTPEFSDQDWIDLIGSEEGYKEVMKRMADLEKKGELEYARPVEPEDMETRLFGDETAEQSMIDQANNQAVLDKWKASVERIKKINLLPEGKRQEVLRLPVGDGAEKMFFDILFMATKDSEEWVSVSEIAYARSRVWAQETGRPATEWFEKHFAGGVVGGEYKPGMFDEGVLDQLKQIEEATGINPRGAIVPAIDNRVIFHAFESADVSTLVHELGHVFRKDLAGHDLKIASEWAGAKFDEETKVYVWDKPAEEKFAKGFERYLAEGKAPSIALKHTFDKLKHWILEIYSTIRGSKIDIDIPKDMREVYDRLLSTEGERALLAEISRKERLATPAQMEMLKPEETMPLFTGTAMKAEESVFNPPTIEKQDVLPGMETRPEMKGAKAGGEELPLMGLEMDRDSIKISAAQATESGQNMASLLDNMDILGEVTREGYWKAIENEWGDKLFIETNGDTIRFYSVDEGADRVTNELSFKFDPNGRLTADVMDETYSREFSEDVLENFQDGNLIDPRANIIVPRLLNDPVYRFETGFKHKKGTTAADVVKYEVEKLGNNLVNLDKDIMPELQDRPASDLIWVTGRMEDALRYGDEPEELYLPGGSRIVAGDGDGGYLILKGDGFSDVQGAFSRESVFMHSLTYYLHDPYAYGAYGVRLSEIIDKAQNFGFSRKDKDKILIIDLLEGAKVLDDPGYKPKFSEEGKKALEVLLGMKEEPKSIRETKTKPPKPGEWQDTESGPRRVLYQDEDNILLQEGSGRVRRAKMNQPVDAVRLPVGSVDSLNPGFSMRRAQEEYFNQNLLPLIENLRTKLTGAKARTATSLRGANLDPATLRALKQYIGYVNGRLTSTKLAATRWGEMKRDMALLNYTKRYGFDNSLMAIMPYEFFYGRTMMEWAMRFIDKPSYFANYARIRNMQGQGEDLPGYPSRLKGKMRMNIPWLPEGWGGQVFFDPLHQLFPMEMLLQPYDKLMKQESMVDKRMKYILEGMIADEKITVDEARAAWTGRNPDLLRKVRAQAMQEIDAEITNPLDFMEVVLSPSMPIQILQKIMQGKPETIGQLPATRFINAITQWLTPGGVNIESGIRRMTGLPERGQYGDFYIYREMANMAATGEYSVEDIQLAMANRSGEPWTKALQRTGSQLAAKNLVAGMWMDFFPEGEEEQREAGNAWSQAIASNDPNAIVKFYQQYPEYSARQMAMKFDNPDEILHDYLKNEVWRNWRALPELHQKQVQEYLGKQFQEAFLNKETRDYDAIDSQTLAIWAKVMGGRLPDQTPVGNVPGMPELSPQDAKVYQDYLDARKRFDDANIFEIEKFYYSLPEGRDRDEFRQQYPILGEYEQWKNTYKAQHPEVIPFTTSEKNEMYGVPTGIQAVVYKYKADRDKQFPNIFKTQADYFMIKDKALRSVFLKKHPELTKYWDWKKAFEKVNPEVIPYIETPESIAEAMTREDYLNPTGEVYDQVQGYYNTRDRLFPGILDIQNMYYAKPAGTERKAFLKEYPELKDYWSFRRAYMAANPDAIPYIQSTESTAEDVLGEDYEDKYGVNFKPDPKDFTTPLVTTLMAYYATNKPLGKGSYDTLMRIWKKNGRPGGTFEVFLNYVLPNSLGSMP